MGQGGKAIAYEEEKVSERNRSYADIYETTAAGPKQDREKQLRLFRGREV
jgi:hypothetical protein